MHCFEAPVLTASIPGAQIQERKQQALRAAGQSMAEADSLLDSSLRMAEQQRRARQEGESRAQEMAAEQQRQWRQRRESRQREVRLCLHPALGPNASPLTCASLALVGLLRRVPSDGQRCLSTGRSPA